MNEKIRKLFFERQQQVRGELPKTFVYDVLPIKVRNQVIQIWHKSQFSMYDCNAVIEDLREALGLNLIAIGNVVNDFGETSWSSAEELKNFFLNTNDVDHALTALEEIGSLLMRFSSDKLERINERLRQAGIGWKHTGQHLIKIEDETYFNEVISRCLSILNHKKFADTQRYLMNSYNELKGDNFDDALTDCRMALETIVKTRLLEAGFDNIEHLNWSSLKKKLQDSLIIPPFMESYLTQILSIMEGSVTPSNKEGAHAKPEGARFYSDELFVRYIINQVAANVLFIAEAEFKDQKK